MRKKNLRKVALVMALICSLTVTGCNKAKKSEGDGETKELSYWVTMDPVLATHVQSFNDVAMYKKREEESGIHINFIHPAAGQAAEQFNVMIASGQLPDIIEYNWGAYPGGAQKAIDDGIIIPLDDYLDMAPNFKKALEKGELAEQYRKGSTTDTGQHFGFTALNIGDYRIFGGIMIRRDWLKELKLDMPETIDDWTKVLRAFKQKGAKTPLTGSGFPELFVGAYDIGPSWYIDNDVVKYGPMQPGYKDFLKQLHDWYEEGLIDKDILTNQSTLVDSKILDGTAGAISVGYIGSSLGRYLKQKETEDSSYDLTGAPYPVRKKGDIYKFANGEGDVMLGATLAITSACKDIEAAVKWCDFWYSDEGYKLMNFGVEGESYNMVDSKPVYTDEILKNSNGLSINEALQMYCRATAPAPGFKQAPEYLQQYYQYPQQIESLNLWSTNTNWGRKTSTRGLIANSEEADEIAALKADLETYVAEKRWKFITGSESLDNFDKYVEELKKSFRIDDYQKIMQNQYERFKKR